MCNCTGTCSGSCVIDLTSLGQTGDTGPQGGYGGYSSEWNFSTSTVSGTTAGLIRFNSATYASVTTMYINKTNADSTDLDAFLSSFSNGTYYGKLRVFKKSDSSKFWEGTITAVSAGATEYTLTVTYILANSTFAASDAVVVTFTPHGIGAKPILYTAGYNITSPTTGSWVTPASCSFTLPAGLLVTNGDYIELIVEGDLAITAGFADYNAVRAMINSNAITSGMTSYSVGLSEILHHSSAVNGQPFMLKIMLERTSNTTVIATTIAIASGMFTHTYIGSNLTVNSLTGSSNTVEVQIYQDSQASSISIQNIKAIKYLQ